MSIRFEDIVSVRYMVNDVQATLDFYTTHCGFTPNTVFCQRSSTEGRLVRSASG